MTQSNPYTRSFALEDISIRAGGDGRTVDAYAAVFDVPAAIRDQDGEYDEVLDPSCFNRAISDAAPTGGRQTWKVGVFYNHGMTIFHTPSERHSEPIGVPLEIRADSRGLFTRTRYHHNAENIIEGIREGSITNYSFSGAFRRSDPVVPAGKFRADRSGNLPTVRRMESTLREYGPTPFPAYADAVVTGVRAEQAAVLLGALSYEERQRLIELFRSGAPLDSPDADAPNPGLVAEDSRHQQVEMRSGRSLKEEFQAQRARFLIRRGGING